ncbi:MAG: DUF853 family protein [Eubacteriales bacterium]|nr:DUF853 family protein [Eubacteriales bacterium]
MIDNGMVYFAKTGDDLSEKICLNPKMANRHGFICGATGTGKTVTLKVLSESFSKMGVPVFLSDVKGDLSGFIMAGQDNENMQGRIKKFGLEEDFEYQKFPSTFYDIYGEQGIPLRTTVSEMGPLLLGQCLGLNATQADVLSVIFKIADDKNLLLYDTKDLKAMLTYVSENIGELELEYGHIAKATITTIIRAIVALEGEGADQFFGEPGIDITDFFSTGDNGYGMINILSSETLINKPKLYTAFMLYLMSEMFETLPEVGDAEKPKMVFFFDEAHLLFNSATPALLDKIAQVVKLIRSKGVGIYFVTQSPADIPNDVMAQLSNKIEHALRAYTPKEMKAVKTAAESFRENPAFDTAELLQSLGTGEAVVSMLDAKGIPGMAQHAYILPPESLMGTITDAARKDAILTNPLADKYSETIDSDSCYEFMQRRKAQIDEENQNAAEAAAKAKEEEKVAKEKAKEEERLAKEQAKAEEKAAREQAKAEEKAQKEAEKAAAAKGKAVKQGVKGVASTTSGSIGREIGKAVGGSVGGSFGKTLGGNIGASLGRNIIGTLFKL